MGPMHSAVLYTLSLVLPNPPFRCDRVIWEDELNESIKAALSTALFFQPSALNGVQKFTWNVRQEKRLITQSLTYDHTKGNWPLAWFSSVMVPKVHLHSEKSWWGRCGWVKGKWWLVTGSVTHCGWVPGHVKCPGWESISPPKEMLRSLQLIKRPAFAAHLSGITLLSNCPPGAHKTHAERQ